MSRNRLPSMVLAMATLVVAVDVRCLGADEVVVTPGEVLWVRRVWPLFQEKCLACHGADPGKLKGGFRMTDRAALLSGGESGKPAVVPGEASSSPLLRAIDRLDPDLAMPPKEADRLTSEQVGWVREWISSGAPWPDPARAEAIARIHADKWSAEDGVSVATSGGLSAEWTGRRYKPDGLWAYQPVRKPAVPSGAALHPIDAFLEARMSAGAARAPLADRVTLLRRVTFDLTGLPPEPEAVDAFVADADPDERAFAKVVERLLASPHYGERMAQHWLDVVRYADSAGFSNDYERGNAWRYRDYVVRAFNQDRPYDRFVREQLAGDELAPDDPEMRVATGFLRMGPWELTSMEVAKIARQRFLDDVVNSVGETFLAHPLQCARCHDHKFDPVPTRDYYAIQAVFATTQLAERDAAFLPDENQAGFGEIRFLRARQAEHVAELRRLDERQVAAAAAWMTGKGLDPRRWNEALAEVQRGGGAAREQGRVFESARGILARAGVPEDQYPPRFVGFTPAEYGLERVARKGLERLRWELERYEPFALSVYNGRTPQVTAVTSPMRMPADRMSHGELESTCVLPGGDPFGEGPKVRPGILSAVGAKVPADIPDSIVGRRRAFASWVIHPENPLAARVMVNRIWLWHFGRGLAGNPNNFGSTGRRPTHPELLDWLAATFVGSGWSVKSMHRLILTSEAYRRGSIGPAGGEPVSDYGVFRARRLTAEELRDAMLAATGELNPQVGGIPNRPEIHPEAALQPRQVMGTFAAAWVPNARPEDRHRRSLYALRLRGLPDPMMEVFNQPPPDFSCEAREASTVTPQVFGLFNSHNVRARALALASRALRGADSDAMAVERCFRWTFGRSPRATELEGCLTRWRTALATPASPAATLRAPVEVVREAVEENTGERFRFVERLHANAEFVPDPGPDSVPHRTRALAEVCLVLFNTHEFVHVD